MSRPASTGRVYHSSFDVTTRSYGGRHAAYRVLASDARAFRPHLCRQRRRRLPPAAARRHDRGGPGGRGRDQGDLAGGLRRVRHACLPALTPPSRIRAVRRVAVGRTGVRVVSSASVSTGRPEFGPFSTAGRVQPFLSVPGPNVADNTTRPHERVPTWPPASTGTRRSTSPSHRSTSSTARARSCAWATGSRLRS